MSTDCTCPFRSQQQMAALAGSASLVRLDFPKGPDESPLFAHSAQLMAVSGVLRGLLLSIEEATAATGGAQPLHAATSSTSDNEQPAGPQSIPLDDESTKAWETVLSMLYPQTMLGVDAAITVGPVAAEALLVLADKYDMPMVTERCKSVLASRTATTINFLTPASAFQWLYVCSRFKLEQSMRHCIAYIVVQKLQLPDGFAHVQPEDLQQLQTKMQEKLRLELTAALQIARRDLAAARKDAKDALLRETLAREEASDAKAKVNSLAFKLKLRTHYVHHQLPVKHVALGNSEEYVILWDNETMSISKGLPGGLGIVLKQWRKHCSRVEFVSINGGKSAGWFAQTNDGCEIFRHLSATRLLDLVDDPYNGDGYVQFWCCPDPQCREDESKWSNPGWIAIDGARNLHYDRVIPELEDVLDEAGTYGGVVHVAVSPEWEWYVRHGDGTARWSDGLPEPLLTALRNQQEMGECQFLELGADGCFFGMFESSTVWCGPASLTNDLIGPLAPKG